MDENAHLWHNNLKSNLDRVNQNRVFSVKKNELND